MKLTEEQKANICDYIENALGSSRLMHQKDEDGNGIQLVDALSPFKTIQEGKEEVNNIAEQIYFYMDNWDI
jgi:hypothetical protein